MFTAALTIFGLLLIAFGFWTKRWIGSGSDFLLSSRGIGYFISFAGIVAIGVAGNQAALISGYSVGMGFISSQIPIWGWMFVGMLGFALVYGKIARRSGAQTIPEYLEMRFNAQTRTIASLITTIGLLSIAASNITGVAAIISGFTGWNVNLASFILFAILIFFTFMGGLWAVTITDFVQMLIAFVLFPLAVVVLLIKFGGPSFLSANWPGPSALTQGISGGSMPIFSPKFPSALTWWIQLGLLTFGTSYYWMRAAASRNEKIARNSYLFGIIPLALFIFPLFGLMGIYAASINPTTFAPIGKVGTAGALGVLLKSTPELLAALVLLAVIAAGISTSTTAYIGAIGTCVRDLYQRLYKKDATPKQQLAVSKWITLIAGAIMYAYSFFPGGFYAIVGASFVWLVPIGVLMLFAQWRKITPAAAFWGLVLGVIVMVIFMILNVTGVLNIFNTVHLSVIGLVLCAAAYWIISYISKPKYYGEASFVPGVVLEKNPNVTTEEKHVLGLIREGFVTMSEICDFYERDTHLVNRTIESLDRKGLIKRKSYTGADFFLFELMKKGAEALQPLNEIEERLLREHRISLRVLDFLRAVQKQPGTMEEFMKQRGYHPLALTSIVHRATEEGYVKQLGFFTRRVCLSSHGRELIGQLSGLTVPPVNYSSVS